MIGYWIIIGALICWIMTISAISAKRKSTIESLIASEFKVGKKFWVAEISNGKIIVCDMVCDVIEIRNDSVQLGAGNYWSIWFNSTRCFSTEKKALDSIRKQVCGDRT